MAAEPSARPAPATACGGSRCDLAEPGSDRRDRPQRRRPRVVFHLAGAVRGDRTLDAVAPTLRANLVGTVELLEAATRAGCERIVISGSLLEEPVRPASAARAALPVRRLALGGERLRAHVPRAVRRARGEPPAVVRIRPGPGAHEADPARRSTALLDGGSPELSSGERRLDCVYADDVARAYVGGRDRARGRGPHDRHRPRRSRHAVREIVDLIVENVGPSAGRPGLRRRAGPRARAGDRTSTSRRPRRVLGWRATTGLEEGLRRTVAWFRERIKTGPGAVCRAGASAPAPSRRWNDADDLLGPRAERRAAPPSPVRRRPHGVLAGRQRDRLAELARELSEAAFAPHDPQVAQESMPPRALRRDPRRAEADVHPPPAREGADRRHARRARVRHRQDLLRRAAAPHDGARRVPEGRASRISSTPTATHGSPLPISS